MTASSVVSNEQFLHPTGIEPWHSCPHTVSHEGVDKRVHCPAQYVALIYPSSWRHAPQYCIFVLVIDLPIRYQMHTDKFPSIPTHNICRSELKVNLLNRYGRAWVPITKHDQKWCGPALSLKLKPQQIHHLLPCTPTPATRIQTSHSYNIIWQGFIEKSSRQLFSVVKLTSICSLVQISLLGYFFIDSFTALVAWHMSPTYLCA